MGLPQPVPEAPTLALVGAGLVVGFASSGRRRTWRKKLF
jgi:hypothetical protein